MGDHCDIQTGVQYIVRRGEKSNDMTPLLNADGTLDLHPAFIEDHKSGTNGKPVVSGINHRGAANRLNIPIDERFTIIDAKCSIGSEMVVKLEIFNNTNREFRNFDFMVSSYDRSGGRYYDSNASDFDVEPQHSGWTDEIYTHLPYLKFGSIKVHSYYDEANKCYELYPKPEIKLEDMQVVEDIG